ncbi:MAG: hypothetical protein ACRD4P_10325 [Bryobacteraceae bacterium]
MLKRRAIGRAVFVLLVLCATAWLQTASLTPNHLHDHSDPAHSCVICHIGHLPLMGSSVSPELAPAISIQWAVPPEKRLTPANSSLRHRSSRAPPQNRYSIFA